MKKVKPIDIIMASVIFIVVIIELVRFVMSNIPIDRYLEYWFPVMSTWSLFFFALYHFLKLYKYRHCIYTRIVVSVYFFIQIFNLSAYFCKFGLYFYSEWVYPIIVVTVIGIIQIKISRRRLYNKKT